METTKRKRKRKLTRILAGTDFSPPGTDAVVRASMLAAEHGAKLEIVHVTPRLDKAGFMRLGLAPSVGSRPDPVMRRRLQDLLRLARSHGAVATVKHMTGGAATTLAREAERITADLVVVGARSRRSLRDAVIGTTAERLMERCKRDILIVKKAPRSAYGTILACVALAPVSGFVVRSAAVLARRGRLHVLHVYEPPFERKLVSLKAGPDIIEEHRLETKREAVRGLAGLLRECQLPAEDKPRILLRRGNPSHVIVRAAERLNADIVAVGKNQSAVEEFFLGSATKRVLRAASADILVSTSHPTSQ